MTNTASCLLHLNHIHKTYSQRQGELQVLEDISMAVYAHEIVAIVGPSGCGKTTLLNIISGLIPADQGEREISSKARLAYVFQEPRLLPWLTVEANIAFVQHNYFAPAMAAPIRERLLMETGLWAYRDAYPSQLSGGMKQRLEIVRALAIKPSLLLMDEPFKSLDMALKYQLQKLLLAEYAREKFAVVLITHDPQEAVLLADRVLLLSDKPTRICHEVYLEMPRKDRTLKDAKLYQQYEGIMEFILKVNE